MFRSSTSNRAVTVGRACRTPERQRHDRDGAHVRIGFHDRREIRSAAQKPVLVFVSPEHEIDARHLSDEILIGRPATDA